MRNVLFAALLCVGSMTSVAASAPTIDAQLGTAGTAGTAGEAVQAGAKVKRYMYQCALRAKPADWPSNAIWLAYGSMVEVNSGTGAWIYVFHHASGAFGWTLKQYFSLTPCP